MDSRSELAADEDNHRQSQPTDTRPVRNESKSNPRSGDTPSGLSPADLISSPETLDTPSIDTPIEEQNATMAFSMASYGINIREDDPDATSRGLGVGPVEDPSGSSSDERKSEDLFLNIARKEAAHPADSTKAERRRSRISLPFLSNNRPSSSRGQDSATETFDPSLLTPKTEVPQTYNKRSSFGWQNSAASAHPFDSLAPNSARSRYATSQSRTGPPSTTSRETRPRSPEDAAIQRQYSGLNGPLGGVAASRTRRFVSDSNSLYVPKAAAPTESTISTTAPSTVWDELDDLKSRIKKLELTGKLPTSSAAAMSSMERPRTATTTVTTMSSSPKHNKNIAHMQSAIEGVPSTVHPLLHEALSKVQGTVSKEIYQKLQATALDALQLTSMMGGGDQASNAAAMGIPPAAERQIRRRADDMCRNLTELAIALSAAEPRSAVSPPPVVTRDVSGLPNHLSARRMSNEPEADRAALMSRAQSRLESRRTSLRLGAENRFGFSSPIETYTPPGVLPLHPASASRVQRTATVLRNRRGQGYDGAEDDDTSIQIRPVSRARTDIGRSRVLREAADRPREAVDFSRLREAADFSREYTSQHPMPAPTQYESRAPLLQSLGSSHLLRRNFASPGSIAGDSEVASSPITPAGRGFGRVSLVGRQSSAPLSSPIIEGTPENVTVQRGSGGSRRSQGLASRIGSTVGSRLRAVRAERIISGARRESEKLEDARASGMTREQVTDDEIRPAEQNRMQMVGAASVA